MAAGLELPVERPPGDEPERGSREPSQAQSPVRKYLEQSRKRWQTADSASFSYRQAMRVDQKFATGGGNQWETEDRQARADEGRPCIEINRIQQFIRQVANQNRLNRSQIRINPRGKEATRKLATAIQGLVRSVEVQSDADAVYDTATQHQLTSGLGFVGLYAVWSEDDPFQQVARIRRIRNPLSVYWDPSALEASFADMRWCHVIGVIGKDEYESRFGKVAPYQSLTEFMSDSRGDIDDWMPEGKVVIAEYYDVRQEDREILKLDTGQTVWATEWEKFQEMAQTMGQPPPVVARTRKMPKRIVRWSLHNAVSILEGNDAKDDGRELPGTRIPIFPLIGDEFDCDGTIDYRGMVRDARDPQKMYNFWASSIAEAVALAPKAPWIAAKGQVERYMDDWKEANRKAKAVLYYDPKDVAGNLVPPPQRNVAEPAIQAMVQGLQASDRDLMSVMGLFQPSLGERGSNTESGKAREALVQQGNLANSNYLDNLQRMKRAIGRALLEWFPVIYDVPRIMNLEQPDGKMREAIIFAGAENQPYDGEFGDLTEMYNIGVGSYDVTVDTGPSFQTERQHTEAWLLDLFKVLPGLAEVGADIVLENSDNPAAQQLAARAKKMVNPRFLDEGDPDQKLAKLEAENAQMQDLLQKANNAIGAMAKVIETKELDNDTKKQIAVLEAAVALEVAAMKGMGEAQKIDSAERQGQQKIAAGERAAEQKTALAREQGEQKVGLAREQGIQKVGVEREKMATGMATTAFQAEVGKFAQMADHIATMTVADMDNDAKAKQLEMQQKAEAERQESEQVASAQAQQTDIRAQQAAAAQEPKAPA